MYFEVLLTANWVLIGLMCLSVVLLIYKIFFHVYALMPAMQYPEAKKLHKFAILVPARNESKVIGGLLKSFDNVNYPKDLFDIYVVVENENDPTINICKQFVNVFPFVRPNLNVKSKGGALDQILKHLISNGISEQKCYEAYFIFDADNTVTENYLREMNKSFDAGYKLALSYRNAKNWNDGWIASCSALTFSMLNTFQNKCRSRFTQNVLVSGTGFYIAADIINELGGWPFQSLTEDVEISNFAVLNGIKATYNENAEHFDEQPTTLKVSWNQRIRWVKGQMQVTKKYQKKLLKSALYSKQNRLGKLEFGINIIPVVVPLVSVIVYAIFTLTMGFVGLGLRVPAHQWQMAFINFGASVFGIYVFFCFYALAMLLAERKHINITFKNAVCTILMNPFFMGLYLPIYLVALFKKEVKWKPIEHNINEAIVETNYTDAIVPAEETDEASETELAKQLEAEFIKKD